MKKLLLLPAFALAAFAPALAQDEQTPETKRVYRVPVDRPTPWTIMTTSESVDISIPIVGGLTGSISDAIDDDPFTFWQTDPNKCDGSEEHHFHWFLIDRGENAPEFRYASFQQRVIDVVEGSEDEAAWNGAIDKAEIYLTDENIGLWGGSANIDYDNITLNDYTSSHEAALKADLSITDQNRQVFDFGQMHGERYILVMITHAVNPNQSAQPEDKFASLAEFNLYGEEIIEEEDIFHTPYETPWGANEAFAKNNHNGRRTHYLTLSGGYITKKTPYLQKGCFRWYEHDDTAYDLTNFFTYRAKAGSTITLTPNATGNWMHNFVFVDWAGDGFDSEGDLVSYVNSGNHNMNEPRTFTIPEGTAAGLYRVRYKTDWAATTPTLSQEISQTFGPNSGQVVVDFYLEVVDPASEVTATLKFPHPTEADQWFTQTFEGVPAGADIITWFNEQDTPIEQAYTILGVEGDNTVTADHTEFVAFGSYKVDFDHAFRIKVKPQEGSSRFMIYDYGTNQAYVNTTTDKSDDHILSPDRLWYFKYVDLTDEGLLKVTLHNVLLGDEVGATTTGSNSNKVTFTENPTTFVLQSTTNNKAKTTDFVLRVDGFEYACLNDFGGYGILAVYNNNNNASVNDNGAIIRVSSLNETQYTEIEKFTVNGIEFPIQDEDGSKREAAKDSNIEGVRALFTYDHDLFVRKSGEDLYKNTAGVDYTIEGVSVPGYLPADNEMVVALRNALVADDTEQISAATSAIENATITWQYQTTPGALYILRSTDLSARGYLCNNNGNFCSTKAPGAPSFDENSDNFKFTFIELDGKRYIYNIGAKKFINGFGQKSDKADANIEKRTDYTWRFSDVPTAVRDIITYTSSMPHTFAILGGVTSGSSEGFPNGQVHEGGITIVNGCNRNVLVCTGVTGRGDGTGLYADYVGKISDEELAAIVAAAEGALAAVPFVPGEFDEINGIVNHFDAETHAKLSSVTNGGGLDHVAHLVDNGTRQGFEAGKVYNFFTDDTHALKVNPVNQTLEVAEFTLGDNSFNLEVKEATAAAEPDAVDVYMDGPATTYNFVHNIQNQGADNFVNMSYNGTTEHTLDMSELGKVKLGDEVLVAKEGTGTATTGIAEITATDGSLRVYDLQGRKLAVPAKGINIVNGKKVLVK